ncbi:kinase-like domain-containing protein [Zopfochytrium polystomum]|nr:kinase-like domain-containing protein [Zopfochytrium polystomum]
MEFRDFSFCVASEVEAPVRCRIASLEGHRPQKDFLSLLDDPLLRHHAVVGARDTSECYISCQLFADNSPLSLPIRTQYRCFQNHLAWNEWITFPVSYKDLPLSTLVAFTVWDSYGPRRAEPIGGAAVPLFNRNNTLRKGKHKLQMWYWSEADGHTLTTTPGKVEDSSEMDRLERIMRQYERGDLPRVDWMDYLVFREIESINKKEHATRKKLFLYIELPQFDHPVVYSEKEYSLPPFVLPRMLDAEYLTVDDPESVRDNPVESKHRKLARSHRNGPLDRDLKPNSKLRDDLNKIVKYPPTQNLTTEEKDLLWKFRFYLTQNKKALTKFLKCIEWQDSVEVKQAVDLILGWAEIDVEDALELLGQSFRHPQVRGYAVLQLKKANDEDLRLFLLQLVQALKFENITEKSGIYESPLADFLIDRSIKNPILGNYFYWYLMVECEDKQSGRMYGKVASQFMAAMAEVPDGLHRRDVFKRQSELVGTLAKLSREVRLMKESRPRRIEKLQAYIADPKNGLLSFPPIPLPLDAHVQITGIIPEKAMVFKSNLFPLKLTFLCLDGSEYPVMFKTGDDLRQDQLVVQIIMLMDKLLRKENLDLKLTPYKVLATGSDQGMVQFIPSSAVAAILAENGYSLAPFLKGRANEDIPAQAMETYVRSCAGYSVITYLLGIGDRHLDNILLTTNGNLFHIDFGYMLGRDPKPFPPPMKLSKEIIDVMGGTASPHYQKFKSYCFIAFNNLRKSANLILNLFALMVSANVPDIALEPDKAVQKVQEKFRLDLTDEESIQFFQALINESVGALLPQVVERIHMVAQLLRS